MQASWTDMLLRLSSTLLSSIFALPKKRTLRQQRMMPWPGSLHRKDSNSPHTDTAFCFYALRRCRNTDRHAFATGKHSKDELPLPKKIALQFLFRDGASWAGRYDSWITLFIAGWSSSVRCLHCYGLVPTKATKVKMWLDDNQLPSLATGIGIGIGTRSFQNRWTEIVKVKIVRQMDDGLEQCPKLTSRKI